MHQPYYRNLVTGACSMPWVRLHATKDYVDMVARLEQFPTIHQTFNLVPSLLDQLEEYLPPKNQSDTFFDLSFKSAKELSAQEQRFILQWFFMASLERMIKPCPRYHDLLAKRGLHVSEADWPRIQKRFHAQDYLDLQVWFNLAWIDPWLRKKDATLARLETKGAHFSEDDKRYILEQHRLLIAKVIPAYKEAAARGQIELSSSPYYHPILPLLCDVRSANVALPHLLLPQTLFRHPEDAKWHLKEGLLRHKSAFGELPAGFWPPEGSVSEEVVRLAIEANVRWIATDEEILWRTIKSSRSLSKLYRPHILRRKGAQLAIIFRDRELSDVIGFVYSQWDSKIAVADFMKRLENIQQQFKSADQPALVSIILDGENAWESYQNDGHEFLMGLYEALSRDERFQCVTVGEFLAKHPLEGTESLPELFSGSWIDGNFATWIGHQEKNAAWVQLAKARESLAKYSREDPAYREAWKSLSIAQGSDWMWWFGDTHFSAQAEEFDQLFRAHLANAYHLAGLSVPETLALPIRRQAAPSLLDPTGIIHPTIDGRESSYYEWLYAGRIDLRARYAAIHRGSQCLECLHYGFDAAYQYLRFDLNREKLPAASSWMIELSVAAERIRIMPLERAKEQRPELILVRAELIGEQPIPLACALGGLLELSIPFSAIGLKPGERLPLAIALSIGDDVVERYPEHGTFEIATAMIDQDHQGWSV
jgi:alpha-amylase/alpha-mannosidase (GH57 family)